LAELEEILRRRVGRDKERAAEAWEAVKLGLVDARRVLPREHSAAARAMKKLRPLHPAGRRRKVQLARSGFRTPAQVEAFFAEAASLLREDPGKALEWLDLAAEVVFWLPGRHYPPGVVAALGLRAIALKANALRVAGDLRAADEIFRRLRSDRRRTLVAEPEVRAELASLEASLRQDQRRFVEAETLLTWALDRYRAAGDGDGAAKALIQQAIVSRVRGEPAAALPLLREAAGLVDAEQAPRRCLEVQHNLALCLCQLGAHEEAAAVVAANRALYDRFPDSWTQLLLRWLEARLARASGSSEAAERAFLEVRNGYIAEGLPYDVALATLDLAELYVQEGRTAEVKRLAAESMKVFADQELVARVEHALRLFHKAAAAERVSLVLLARLRGYLEGAHRGGRPCGRLPS
jgi:hypothetical protein